MVVGSVDHGAGALTEQHPPDDRHVCTPMGLGLGRLAPSGTKAVTPFTSPERVRSKATQLDATADGYALGALLYTLVALEPPYARESAREASKWSASSSEKIPARHAATYSPRLWPIMI